MQNGAHGRIVFTVSEEAAQLRPALLFSAFEPSGDAMAAPVIAALVAHRSRPKIYAYGGPKMVAAGAELLEQTVDGSAMGFNAVGRSWAVRKLARKTRDWAAWQRILAHIPVDSPAANFPICKVMRASGARVIHLVAPQIWAWGRWRLRKLRRLTDLVLCVLPFEEQWFSERNVPARFIGHPAINRAVDLDALREQLHGLPQGAPRLGIFPGSRTHEVKANTRLLVDAYSELRSRHSGLCGVIVAATPDLAKMIRRLIRSFPTNLHMITGSADAVIAWCDLALAVSGTITLDITVQRKPMIGVYKTGLPSWLAAKLLVRPPYWLLPNIIAEREIVPEFVPHLGGPLPIVREATRFLLDSKHAAIQSEELHRVCLRFANHDPAADAVRLIIKTVQKDARGKPPSRSDSSPGGR